jgi:hypothetical protein
VGDEFEKGRGARVVLCLHNMRTIGHVASQRSKKVKAEETISECTTVSCIVGLLCSSCIGRGSCFTFKMPKGSDRGDMAGARRA